MDVPPRGTRALAPTIAALFVWLTLGGLAAAAEPLGTIAETPVPTAEAEPGNIAAGPDGNLWFTEYKGQKIGRITPAGEISELSVPTANAHPEGIAAGPEGNVWFTERTGDKIGRITPAGEIAEFPLLHPSGQPESIAAGPDGDMWFTEDRGDAIGRITPGGEVTEFPVPTPESQPMRIAAGPDGDLWFTEYKGNAIGQITPAGQITQFPLPDPTGGPWGIAAGVEGQMWFSEFRGDRIGRITTSGEIAEFPLPSERSLPEAVAPGPDGNIWFVEYKGGRIGRITPTGEITQFPLPDEQSAPAGLAAGADGQMWFAESKTGAIGRIATGSAAALASPPVVLGGAQAGATQACQAGWSTWGSIAPSADLYAFDGYIWLLEGAEVAQGQTFTPTSADVGAALSCAETVTYPVLAVSDTASSAPVEVAAPAPVLTLRRVRQSRRRWREGHAPARISRAGGPPVGTTFSFDLDEKARVELAFSSLLRGHRVGRDCRPGASHRAGAHRCLRERPAGKLVLNGRSGRNKVLFQGRISPSRSLRPGVYAVQITVTVGTQHASADLRFTILR